jgi:RNA polymerase sigma-70 factor, ECF subfamily
MNGQAMAPVPFRILRNDAPAGASDEALVAGLLRGEAHAELAVWNRFSPRVDATLRRLLGPGVDREDLLQEVFIRFFRRVGTLRDPSALGGFLTGICIHVVHGEFGRQRRQRWLRLTSTGHPPEATTPGADTDAREAVTRYYRLVAKLGPGDRSLFVSRTIEGLTLEQVATLHGLSLSTTQRRLIRATKRIALLVRRDPMLVALAERGRS